MSDYAEIKNKPNIIYILADDMGYGDLNCNNPDSKIPTPNLDALAESGMRFTDAHAASSVCTPSRYSILTGRYCWRTQLKSGVLWAWDPALIEPERLTVGKMLKNCGYKTTCIGKWHLGMNWQTLDGCKAHEGVAPGEMNFEYRDTLAANIDFSKPFTGGPVDCGFDSYFGVDVPNFPPYTWFEDDHVTDLPTEAKPEKLFGHGGPAKPGWRHEDMLKTFTEKAKDYISAAGDEPFFMYLALTSPHTPVCPRDEFKGKSGAGAYGDFVCETDWVVGQVIEALEQNGLRNNTLVIFTSDNGPEDLPAADGGAYDRILSHKHYSMAHLRGVKRDTWEGGHRVPFIASWPELIPQKSRCDRLTGLIDFMATCAEITGQQLTADQSPDGVSILPFFAGDTGAEPRKSAIYHSCAGFFAIRRDNWVLIDPPKDTGTFDHYEPQWFMQERGYKADNLPRQLFDLSSDISERENLYEKRSDIAAEMETILQQVLKEYDYTPDNNDIEQLNSE